MSSSQTHTLKGITFSLLAGLILVSGASLNVPSVFAGCPGTCGPGYYCASNNTCMPTCGGTKDEPLFLKNCDLTLLEPLDGGANTIAPGKKIGIFYEYFNRMWPWVLGIGAGIGVLQSLIGGIQIMLSGSDSGMREAGKEKMMWALAGLLMVGLAGFILRSINPIFYN